MHDKIAKNKSSNHTQHIHKWHFFANNFKINNNPNGIHINKHENATIKQKFIKLANLSIVHHTLCCRRNNGNKITSRIPDAPVNKMANRSIPIPIPPAGGIPYSNDNKNSLSKL